MSSRAACLKLAVVGGCLGEVTQTPYHGPGMDAYIYNVSQKNPPFGFLKFFPKRLGIFNQFLHTYYAILSTLDYKFLFKYLQL